MKTSYLDHKFRCWSILDNLNFLLIHLNTCAVITYTRNIIFFYIKYTLLKIIILLFFIQHIKYITQMINILIQVFFIDQDIIKIYNYKFTNEHMHHIIHQS
jgi:hypothetical protein